MILVSLTWMLPVIVVQNMLNYPFGLRKDCPYSLPVLSVHRTSERFNEDMRIVAPCGLVFCVFSCTDLLSFFSYFDATLIASLSRSNSASTCSCSRQPETIWGTCSGSVFFQRWFWFGSPSCFGIGGKIVLPSFNRSSAACL